MPGMYRQMPGNWPRVSIAFAAAVSPAANTLGGQGWRQAGELGLALLLSVVIGFEREVRGKDAGLRTHCLVGLGSARCRALRGVQLGGALSKYVAM